jgi:hypothetical protein
MLTILRALLTLNCVVSLAIGILLLEVQSQRAHAQGYGSGNCDNVSCVEPCPSGALCTSAPGQTCAGGCYCTKRVPYICLI